MFELYENGKLLGRVGKWSHITPADSSKPKQCQFSMSQLVDLSGFHSIYFEGTFRWNIKIILAEKGLYLANIL